MNTGNMKEEWAGKMEMHLQDKHPAGEMLLKYEKGNTCCVTPIHRPR